MFTMKERNSSFVRSSYEDSPVNLYSLSVLFDSQWEKAYEGGSPKEGLIE